MKKSPSLLCLLLAALLLSGCTAPVQEEPAPMARVTAAPTAEASPTQEASPAPEPENYSMEDITDIDLYGSKLSLSSVDFSKQPAFKTEEGMFAFIEDCLAKKCRNIVFTCDRSIGLGLSAQEFCEKYHICWINPKMQPGDLGKHYILTVTYYPGDNVAWAYTHKDTSRLSEKELALYEEADRWLKENIREDMSQEEQCIAIHDYLAGTVQYDMELFKALNSSYTFDWGITAYGAMIDHNSICQGYADAFYMLTTMLGMECTQVTGTGSGVPHNWNQVRVGENWYYVDCTFDDAFAGNDGTSSKAYLFIPADELKKTHCWEESAYAPAQDYSLWYYPAHDAVVRDGAAFTEKVLAALEAGEQANLLVQGLTEKEISSLLEAMPQADYHMAGYLNDIVIVVWKK